MSQFDWKTLPKDAKIRFLDEASPKTFYTEVVGLKPHHYARIVLEMADGVPRRRSQWTPTIPLFEPAPFWKMTKTGSFVLSTRDVTIAADGFEVQVLEGRFEGGTARPPNVRKIYTVLKALTQAEVEEWMHHNLPHFVAYNKRERVDKAAERRWINKHATGLWSLTPIKDGVRFAAENDAFWFRMSRT